MGHIDYRISNMSDDEKIPSPPKLSRSINEQTLKGAFRALDKSPPKYRMYCVEILHQYDEHDNPTTDMLTFVNRQGECITQTFTPGMYPEDMLIEM